MTKHLNELIIINVSIQLQRKMEFFRVQVLGIAVLQYSVIVDLCKATNKCVTSGSGWNKLGFGPGTNLKVTPSKWLFLIFGTNRKQAV